MAKTSARDEMLARVDADIVAAVMDGTDTEELLIVRKWLSNNIADDEPAATPKRTRKRKRLPANTDGTSGVI